MALAEIQERRQTQLIARGLFRLLLTSHLPLSLQSEQVTLLSPESEKEDIADDVGKGVNVGNDEDLGPLLQSTTPTLGKLWLPLGASVPAFFLNRIIPILQGS